MVVTVLFLIKGYVVLWWYDALKNTVNCCTVQEGKKKFCRYQTFVPKMVSECNTVV